MARGKKSASGGPRRLDSDVFFNFVRQINMEAMKRNDFLRAFDEMRRWSDWASQPDMFAEADEAHEASAGDGDGDDAGGAAETEHDIVDDGEREPVASELEADGQEDGEAEAEVTEELAGAGFIFAEGKEAPLAGRPAEDNPHPQDTAAHPIWARGHAQGTQDKEAESEAVEATAPARGRRARQPDEAAAVLH